MKREEEERLARQDAEMAGWEKKEKQVREGKVVSSQVLTVKRWLHLYKSGGKKIKIG